MPNIQDYIYCELYENLGNNRAKNVFKVGSHWKFTINKNEFYSKNGYILYLFNSNKNDVCIFKIYAGSRLIGKDFALKSSDTVEINIKQYLCEKYKFSNILTHDYKKVNYENNNGLVKITNCSDNKFNVNFTFITAFQRRRPLPYRKAIYENSCNIS